MPSVETDLNLKQNHVLKNLKSFLFLRDTYYGGISHVQNAPNNQSDDAYASDKSDNDREISEDATDLDLTDNQYTTATAAPENDISVHRNLPSPHYPFIF